MWGGIVGLIIQLISGGVGGNVAGSMMKQYDLGTVGNTIAGVVGGAWVRRFGSSSAAEDVTGAGGLISAPLSARSLPAAWRRYLDGDRRAHQASHGWSEARLSCP
jgi:uncharacterized membrane protein YeaQ/YmgE (transglycosylase-associated protein family)